MNDTPVTQAVADQFRRTLAMFRTAVGAFPPEAWREGKPDYARPAGVAYHVVETIDFYITDQPADMFPWGARFAVGWETEESDLLPSQERILAYLDEVEERLWHWLSATDLLEPETIYPWTGPVKLGRAIYVLRNSQHHLAEMNLERVRRGYGQTPWH